jgi:hypothetical protein
MFIVSGTTNAGKVDQVLDLMHVVTQFWHLYYVPLIPTNSIVVLGQDSAGELQGVIIPISVKSMLVGWLRAGCVVAMIAAVVMIGLALEGPPKPGKELPWQVPVLMASLAAVVLFVSYRLQFITQASYERAVELGQLAQLNDMGMLMIEIAYGRMTAAQADEELAKRDQARYEAELAEQGNSSV